MEHQKKRAGMLKKNHTTPGGYFLEIFKFQSFQELEDYYLEIFDDMAENKMSSKVIGTTLIIFKKENE